MEPDNKALLQQLRLDKTPAAPAARNHTLWWVLAAVVCSVGGTYWWMKPAPAPTPSPTIATPGPEPAPARARSTATGERILNASGYITARQIATVSAKVMGLIESVDVEEGMQVERGQILARIEDRQARLALDTAEARLLIQQAALDSLRLELAEAQREWQRLQDLQRAGNFSSEAQMTRAETLVQRLRANIRSAEAEQVAVKLQVARFQTELDDHTIRAPFSGVVTAKNAQAGEIVAPAAAGGGFTRTGICTIVDMESLEIQVDVNEAYIGRVQSGQPVEAVLDAYPDWPIAAQVAAVIPTADRARATVRVRIQILQKDPRILPDMGVRVSFLAGGSRDE